MLKTILISLLGIVAGTLVGMTFIKPQTIFPFHAKQQVNKQIIGFLPYWQVEKEDLGVISNLTTLTYFALNVDGDGHIVKLANPQQEDPGWYGLHSDKLQTFFSEAKKNRVTLSLLISSGDANAINQLMSKPDEHAKSLIQDVKPLMKQYNFSDLNLDIEDTTHASGSAQIHFTQFVKAVKEQLDEQKLGSLTVEISPTDVIKYNLINVPAVAPYANTIVLMAYDYHSPDSVVTGPVAPLTGAGTTSEYDVATAVERTIQNVPTAKVVLGIPLYGYEWETLNTAVRSAIIPGSGVLASNNRAETFISTCASCSAFFDNESQEAFVVYHDQDSDTYHQISFPDQKSLSAKITYANKENLGGIALWALGYEGNSMLTPLTSYKSLTY